MKSEPCTAKSKASLKNSQKQTLVWGTTTCLVSLSGNNVACNTVIELLNVLPWDLCGRCPFDGSSQQPGQSAWTSCGHQLQPFFHWQSDTLKHTHTHTQSESVLFFSNQREISKLEWASPNSLATRSSPHRNWSIHYKPPLIGEGLYFRACF